MISLKMIKYQLVEYPYLRDHPILIPIMLVQIILVSDGGDRVVFVGKIAGFVDVTVRCEALGVTER